jgi:hypothetical protein
MAKFRYAFAAFLGLGWLAAFALLLQSSDWRPGDSEEWFAFSLPWDDGRPTFIGPRLETPAGLRGFVQVGTDGDFYFQDGRSARFWGVAVGAELSIPPKEIAEVLALRLAKLGFNLVRLSGIDRVLFEPGAPDTRHLDASRLDRFDYWVSQLKAHGIYIDLVLVYSRRFRPGDGVIDGDAPVFNQTYEGQRLLRSMAFVDPYLLKLQKEFAQQFFSHRNPYTGNTYAEEPAMAMLEIINETSLTYGWLRDFLNEDSPEPIRLTSYYSQLLDARWNLWLLRRYGSRDSVAQAWLPETLTQAQQGLLPEEDPAAGTVRRILYSERDRYSKARAQDLLRFYSELERGYFRDFSKYLKEELGVKVPVSGTHIFHGMANQLAQAEMDFAGGHVQWQHPLKARTQRWTELPIRFLNTPMVKGEPTNIPYKADWIETRNTLSRLAYGMSIGGKPFVVSEYNHAFPNEYQAEFPLITSAYSRLQGWDGFVVHVYAYRPQDLTRREIHDVFTIHNNPIVLVQMPIASVLFRRGYVQAAQKRMLVPYTEEQAFQALLDCGMDLYCVLDRRGLNPEAALVHGVDDLFLSAARASSPEYTSSGPKIGPSPYVSDTGELNWDTDRGRVLIDTDFVQAAVGFLGGRTIRLKYLTIQAQTDFAAIALVSLDGEPIPRSRRLLLTATSRVKNRDMVVQRDLVGFRLLTDWGRAPVLVQDVRARLQLTLRGPQALQVFRLDERGQLDLASPLRTSVRRDELIFEIGGQQTLWYGLCVYGEDGCAPPANQSPAP